MHTTRFFPCCLMLGTLVLSGAALPAAAEEYTYDGVHSSVSFKARHIDISWIHGRFNQVSGKFNLDRKEPSKSTFQLTIQVASIDTANEPRDEHLRQGDYFDAKQFPTIEFQSTSVKPLRDGYEVTGDFTMHGVTKRITFPLLGGQEVEWMNSKHVGFSTELKLKRSDFNFDKSQIGTIGDEAIIMIDCEGMRK